MINSSVCRIIGYKSLDDLLSETGLTVSPVTGDGLCLVRAVEIVLKTLVLGVCQHDVASITNMVKAEIVDNIEYYSPFCVAGRSITDDLLNYLIYGVFDQAIADVCVAALCNSLGITLIIYEVRQDGQVSETVHPPGRVPSQSSQYTVQLLRSGRSTGRTRISNEHYDALLPVSCRPKTNTTAAKSHASKNIQNTIPDMFLQFKKRKFQEASNSATQEQTMPKSNTDVHNIQTRVDDDLGCETR